MSFRTHRSPRRSQLTSAILATFLIPFASLAFAQEQAPEQPSQQTEEQADDSQEAEELQRIEVTGSRIKRAEIEGPAPVTIVTAEDIEKEGYATVYDALNTLSQFTGSVQNELNQNGFTANASFLNLRGLGPGYQLILINGRRVADYPLPYNSQSNAVNLANIPASAIDRIEVLSGSASAIYGSDAVAGVVNIILKSNVEGDELTLRGGTTTRGGGDSFRAQWVGGKTGDNWSITYAVEALEREQVFASQRSFMDSVLDLPGVPDNDVNAPEGVLIIDFFNSNRIFPDGAQATCDRFSEFDIYFFERSNFYTGPRCGYFGSPATQAIRNSDSNQSGYFTGTFDFANGTQLFSQLFFTNTKAKLASGTQFWATSTYYDPNLVSADVPVGAFVDLQRIFTPAETGGLQSLVSTFKERSYDAAIGLRGSFGNGRFDWDATLSRSEYKFEGSTPRFLANRLQDYFLGPDLGPDPFFGAVPTYELNVQRFYTPLDPATFRSLNTIVKDEAESDVTQAQFVLSGDLFELPAGPIAMAAVLEAADQGYELNPDPRTNPNYTGPEPIYNLTNTGGGGDRQRYAFGIEFSVPIFTTLTANVAGRYDHYDDITEVGGAATWQLGLEYRPVDNLLVRGTYATSFRAPDMHYIFAEESGFFQTILDEYRCRRDGIDPLSDACTDDSTYVYDVSGIRRGDRNLEEEKGKSFTFGAVWDVTDSLSLTVDYYKIELEDQVNDIVTRELFRNEADCRLGRTRSGQAVDPNSSACQFYLGLVTREAAGGFGDEAVEQFRSIPINQASNKTSGIDASIRYRLDTDRLGDFNLNLSWTHVLSLERRQIEGGELENLRDNLQFFNQRSRMNWSMGWELDDWEANINGYRLGSLPNWGETGRVAPYIIWNAGVAKKITEKATIAFTVQNVLDKLAPRDDSFDQYPYFWGAYSPIGREVFASFNYKFN
jgi:iron complex outermembrane recepter protein